MGDCHENWKYRGVVYKDKFDIDMDTQDHRIERTYFDLYFNARNPKEKNLEKIGSELLDTKEDEPLYNALPLAQQGEEESEEEDW